MATWTGQLAFFGFISQNLIPGCQLGARTPGSACPYTLMILLSAIGIRRVATRLDKARVIFGLPSAVASGPHTLFASPTELLSGP
jgi:hypothetical protein